MVDQFQESASYLFEDVPSSPDVLLILGSGFSSFLNQYPSRKCCSYQDIPHFPVSTVEGHPGKLWLGEIKGNDVMAMMGRFHYYEGYEPEEIVYPVRVAAIEDVPRMIVTNSCGAANPDFDVGDLMLITDHINQLGVSPLRGENIQELGERFPDMTNAYNPDLISFARRVAERIDLKVREGVYLATHGPEYETPAEIQQYRRLGADVVGMSTVPEVIAANHAGMSVLGISCITNMASGISETPLEHDEVIETSDRVQDTIEHYLETILEGVGGEGKTGT